MEGFKGQKLEKAKEEKRSAGVDKNGRRDISPSYNRPSRASFGDLGPAKKEMLSVPGRPGPEVAGKPALQKF